MADPPPVLTLLVQKGPCKGETLRGRAGAAALRVGRVAKGNDVAVRDAGASQSHLSVEFLQPPAARWAVTDLGSSNGSLLNGAPLVPTVPAPLSHGDLIKIGESTLLAVSISTDAGPGPGPAATRRSARNAAAVPAAAEEEEKEEQGPAVTRRAGRKKAVVVEAPEAGKEVKEEPAVVTRRGGRRKAAEPPEEEKEPKKEEPAAVTRRGVRKKAAEPPDAEKEVEEAAVPTRRGGRKKAAEPPEVVEIEDEDEDEEEEAAVPPRRGGPRKAAVTSALPPQPQSTRSTRAAARRGEAAGCGNDDGKVERTGNGRGRVTRASARKGTDAAVQEEEEEGAVAEAEDLEGNLTAAKGAGEEDMVETGVGTSNASDVPAAVRGRTMRRRGGRGRATRASTRKARDAVVEEDEKEQEEKDMLDGRENGSPLRVMAVNDGEEKVATGDDKLDGASKASMEDDRMVGVEEQDVSLAPEEQIGRATKGRISAQHVPAGNGSMEEEEGKDSIRGEENEDDQELCRETMVSETKLDGVLEEEANDKREPIGGNGEEGCVKESTGRSSLKDMALGEWFDRIEKYLLAKNEEAAEKAIAEVQEKHRRFCEHLKTLK